MHNRPILPTEAKTRRQRLQVLRRGLLAARDELRMFYAEEEAIGRYQLLVVQKRLRKRLGFALDFDPQHPPRPLQVPAAYHQPRHLPLFPTITLVTPTRNAGTYLEPALRSVLDQHYPRLDYRIQDAGSTDRTSDILDQYRRSFTHVAQEPDAGPAQGLNRGFAHSSGEILGTLSADDLLLPGALAYVAEFFDRHPEIDVVYGHRVLIDAGGLEVGRWVLPRHSDRILSWVNYIPPETLFWRRRLWDRVGAAFDETFLTAHMWELLVRFRAAGARFARLPRFLGACRVHPERRCQALPAEEKRALWRHCHGREVSEREAAWHVSGYCLRHALYQRAYRRGWIHY